MRTSTFKRIGVIILLVALGLSIIGCAGKPDRSFYAGSSGLNVTIRGESEAWSKIIISTTTDTLTLSTKMRMDPLYWYYDVPNGQSEYVIVKYSTGDTIEKASIHKWISTKPADFGK
jgi:hypothetical protein